MEKRAIIIQARMSSKRLPGKCLKLIGKHPLIYYVIEHLRVLNLPIIIATSSDSSDDILVEYLHYLKDVLVYRGSLNNVLERYVGAAEAFNVEQIIRITADNPFVDVKALLENSEFFEEYQYLDGIYENGWIKGSGFEFVTTKALKEIATTRKDYLEHVTLALREQIDVNPTYTKIALPAHQIDNKDLRLTCDYTEDLEVITNILEYHNYSPNIKITEIIKLSQIKPELFFANSTLS